MMALWSPLKCGEWTRVGIGQRRWAHGMGRPVRSRGGCVASCMEISSHSTSSPFLTRARPPPRVVAILHSLDPLPGVKVARSVSEKVWKSDALSASAASASPPSFLRYDFSSLLAFCWDFSLNLSRYDG